MPQEDDISANSLLITQSLRYKLSIILISCLNFNFQIPKLIHQYDSGLYVLAYVQMLLSHHWEMESTLELNARHFLGEFKADAFNQQHIDKERHNMLREYKL